ncbi:MAG: hypothetical protein ABIC91_07340 [Nanoarchaeota archaeon]|nr:hypothetical protein [Nanoarchaeota archaeon]MBU1031217.1 hypothetical protein [Nanoarchaeota archaeon]MBU1849211.1 hypothetical protein [Nanoarchaeota archaeon]
MHSLLEKHIEEVCPSCGRKNEKEWDSQWDEHDGFAHYLTQKCTCGYELFFRTDFFSSGI